MKPNRLLGSAVLGAAAAVAIVQPARAQTIDIVDVRLVPSGNGVDVELVTAQANRPQVLVLPPEGNSLVAHVTDSRLTIPGGRFVERNPAPGIASVEVSQRDAAIVQVTVTGEGARPMGRIRPATSGSSNVVLSYMPGSGSTASRPPSDPLAQTPFDPSGPGSEVLVPDPDINIDGQPATRREVAPPVMPRAVAPPVGDIAISDLPYRVDDVTLLGNDIIPRLVLRDAPVEEVLSLLARASGTNVAFPQVQGEDGEGEAGGLTQCSVTLDIENESVQDVFNYVLRICDLEAARQGRTVFVGRNLPNSARNVVMRVVRLNQTSASNAAGFLVTLGAESATPVTQTTTEVQEIVEGEEGDQEEVGRAALTQTRRVEETVINELRYDPQDSTPILRGLQVAVDSRTNSVTLVGRPNLVSIAMDQLSRIDSRVRQAAVNVRIIDIDLDAIDQLATSFSFGIDGARIINTAGFGVLNWSDTGVPFSVNLNEVGQPVGVAGRDTTPAAFSFADDFLLQLQATVTNGNAKILTDPTLVVQEGQVAQVELTEEVIAQVDSDVNISDNATTVTSTIEKDRAGLTLGVTVDRIDDNGFVTLSVSPSLKIPIGTFDDTLQIGDLDAGLFATLLAERRLSSGTIRLRDGQTLVLAGIIQDTDRSTVRKVPILGDLPLLGALFRRTERQNERRELVVLLTPQILDDSNARTVGYTYTPSQDAQELIQRSEFNR